MSESEFLQLIHEHRGSMYHACKTYCRDYSQEDLIQEIILQTWKSLKSFNSTSKFNTWLTSISRNVCISTLRKEKTAKKLEAFWANKQLLIEIETNEMEYIMNKIEGAMQYGEVISTIEEPLRHMFIMYLEGMLPWEIAEVEGVDANWLKVNICRIKKRLYLRYGESDQNNNKTLKHGRRKFKESR